MEQQLRRGCRSIFGRRSYGPSVTAADALELPSREPFATAGADEGGGAAVRGSGGPGPAGVVQQDHAGGSAAAVTAAAAASRNTLRLSGTALAPRWRGRVHFIALLAATPAALALGWHEPYAPVLVYASALVALYAVSATYHLFPLSAAWRGRMRRTDHAMIYVFTAASFTPFCVRVVGGTLGWAVLAVVWAGTAAGVAIKLFGSRRAFLLGSPLYLLLGWMGVLTLPAALRLGAAEFSLMVAMGLLYTAGAVALFARRPDPVPHIFGYHEVWHCLVVLASACYFILIWDLPGRVAR